MQSKEVREVINRRVKKRRKLYPESRTIRDLPEGFIRMGNLIKNSRVSIGTEYIPGRKYLFDVLPDNSWKDQPCFIVGGGDSLTGFAFNKLKDHRVIAINRAYENIPFADILFAVDPGYYRDCRTGKAGKSTGEKAEVFKKWETFSGYKVWLDSNTTKYGDVFLLPHGPLYETELNNTMKKGIATGNFSGYAAVNMAMCLGANPIYLLGFDCKHNNGKTHYHSGYERTANETKLKQLALDFDKLKVKSDKLGIEIINLNPDSAIKAFPKDDIKNIKKKSKVKPRKWQLISFYTKDTKYETEVKKLEGTLNTLGIPYHFYGCEQYGSWRSNLNCKSASILSAFKKFPDHDIVFVDADAMVRQYPELFDNLSHGGNFDMAAHFHVYPQSVPGGSLLSGTLWFQNNKTSKELVTLWHDIGMKYPSIRHQHCLRIAIEQMRSAGKLIKKFRMPSSYTCIYDYRANRNVEPVIEHFQASRRLRKEVGKGDRLLDSDFLRIPHRLKGAS